MTVKPITDRHGGMVSFAPINGADGTTVKMYEASDTDKARVYLHCTEQPSFADPSGREIAPKLDLAAVEKLRDMCDWFIKNHYMVRG